MLDLQSFFKMSYGLYVVSAAFEGKQNGCIVNTVMQVTAEPPKVAVAVNKLNLTAELIEKSGMFNAAVLTENATMQLIGRFGFQSGQDLEKYHGIPCTTDDNGICYPGESVGAIFSCKVISQLDLDTHLLFVGEVDQAADVSKEPVMTYAYYHQVKKGLTPPKASSYKKPEEQSGWRCKICGYIHESPDLPADFICPVCKKDASFFEKL